MTTVAVASGPWWLVLGCLAGGAVVGELFRRRLRSLGYRVGDEVAGRPAPRWDWLVPCGTALASALLAWRLGGVALVLLPAHLLLAAVGAALCRIDLDVHRLPEGLTLPSLAAALVLLLPAVPVLGWTVLLHAVVGGFAAWLLFLVLAVASGGAVGLGDATLAGLLGLVVASRGPLLVGAMVVLAFLVGGLVSVVALAARRATLKSSIAFGPYLLIGALLAVLVG